MMIDTLSSIQIIADMYDVPIRTYNMGVRRDEYVLSVRGASFRITHYTSTSNEFFEVKIINNSITKILTIRSNEKLYGYVEMFCKMNK